MAIFESRPTIELNVVMRLTESEVRALDALAGYGDDAFVKVFYEGLGEAYMRDHEVALRSFLKSCREQLPIQLHHVGEARKVFSGQADAVPKPKETIRVR